MRWSAEKFLEQTKEAVEEKLSSGDTVLVMISWIAPIQFAMNFPFFNHSHKTCFPFYSL